MSKGRARPTDDDGAVMAQVVERNIHALLARKQRENERQPLQSKIAEKVSEFAGSMKFVYIHAFIYGLWILINVGLVPMIPRFDPSLVVLAMIASVEAIFISTFILIAQNRMAALADKRADLDLQISLLAEHEITRLIELVSAIAAKMDIDNAHSPELDELKRDVHPERVLDTMEAMSTAHENSEAPADSQP